jgi:hypothetical protein
VNGGCRTALVVHVVTTPVESPAVVCLAVWNANGGQETREGVPVVAPTEGWASFHLAGDCPWKR